MMTVQRALGYFTSTEDVNVVAFMTWYNAIELYLEALHIDIEDVEVPFAEWFLFGMRIREAINEIVEIYNDPEVLDYEAGHPGL